MARVHNTLYTVSFITKFHFSLFLHSFVYTIFVVIVVNTIKERKIADTRQL